MTGRPTQDPAWFSQEIGGANAAGDQRNADYGVTLAAFNAITVRGEQAREQGYDYSRTIRLMRDLAVRCVAMKTEPARCVALKRRLA